ncbi:MAG: ABC transporter permease [Chloroflexota bacterium]|nr:ABC transporter permease [Chloroflexota bacterium]
MAQFLIFRLLYAVAVLLGVTILVFSLIHLSGDPLAGLLPPGSSPAQEAAIRAQLGLDRSLPDQYAGFVTRAARGDFGESWRQGRPALDAVVERLPNTLLLTGLALSMAVVAAFGLSLGAATRPGGRIDVVGRLVATLGQAVPGFWLGTLLILVFAVRLRWLPSSGFDDWRSLVLPAVALAVYPAAMLIRLLRGSLIATMNQDFIRTARSKGLDQETVIRVHALRNALLPAVAFAGLQAGFLLGGAVVIEGVFAFPGIGQLALAAVLHRDLPVIQAVVMVVATLIVLATLLVDMLARWIDPRLTIPTPDGAGR